MIIIRIKKQNPNHNDPTEGLKIYFGKGFVFLITKMIYLN